MNDEQYEMLSYKYHLKFEDIPVDQRLNKYRDLCGIIYLSNLLEDDGRDRIIHGATHGQVWVDGISTFAKLTVEQAIYLLRCGISWEEDYGSFCIFG